MRLQVIATLLAAICCQSAFAHTMAQCPLNSDFDNYCRTYFRFERNHQFSSNINTLIDTYSFQDLLGTNGKWSQTSVDGDSSSWTVRGGICQNDLRVCGYTRPIPQNNWVFSQYVPYLGAREVMVNITFRFSQCTGNPRCLNDYANVYFYSVSSEPASRAPHTNIADYGTSVRRLQQVGRSDNDVHWTFERPANSVGFYIAFQDEGTCGQIRRVHLYYEAEQGVRDKQNFVTCPCIARPYAVGSSTSNECECDVNSMPVGSLTRTLQYDGTVSEQPKCACKPGYQKQGDKCIECPPGTYKATASNTALCLPCPKNSESLFAAAEECKCVPGKVRPPGRPELECKGPPSAPRLDVNSAPEFTNGDLKICWLPSIDNGGSNTLRYNVYEYIHSTELYTKVNPIGITKLCFKFGPKSNQSVINLLVVSATDSTGDQSSLEKTEEVNGRFISMQVIVQGVVPPPVIVPTVIPVDPCTLNPCGQFATCSAKGTTHQCTCIAPFQGDGQTCELPHPCSFNPCDSNAICSRHQTFSMLFMCTCRPPYVGNGFQCQLPVLDPCLSNPCHENAVCMRDRPDSTTFQCMCIGPYQGDGFTCRRPDPCSFNLCDSNADCASQSDTQFTCTCRSPYTGNGFSCQLPPQDPCSSNPCDSNAVCTSQGARYICTCRPPYVGSGLSCQIPDPCSSNPCDSNAVCTSQGTQYTCRCLTPYVGNGLSCQIPDPCSSNLCDSNAVCTSQGTRYTCRCQSPYVGNGFSCQIPDPCSSNPCDSNAVCTNQGARYTCRCQSPYVGNGLTCQIPNPCSTAPCDSNALCTRQGPTSTQFTCTCRPPYIGNGFTCQLPVVTLPPVIVPPEPVVVPEQPFFEMGGAKYQDGDTVCFNAIGEGDNALRCVTQYEECCRGSQAKGEFFYPNGVQVPVRASGQSVYRNRGDSFIRLNLINTISPPPPAGQYRCEIPDTNGDNTNIFITIVHDCVPSVPATPKPAPTTQKPTPSTQKPTQKPTVPPTAAAVRPYFQMGGITYQHGARLSVSRIGSGNSALRCVTQYEDCCKTQKMGEFYGPDGQIIPVNAARDVWYRNRDEGYIRLNRRGSSAVQTGEYCCEIPDIDGDSTRICINLTP